jgi:hypothetical protein
MGSKKKSRATKKFQLVGVALVAVFAVLGMAVALASAAPVFLLAEWLINGVAIAAGTTHPTDSEGSEILFEETILGIKIDVLCSEIFDGTVGANGADMITELLALAGGAAISLTNALLCTNSANCPEPLVVWINLPYKTTLELMEEEGNFFADLFEGTGGAPGFEFECMGSGASDTCSNNLALQVTNEGTNVDSLFSDAFNTLAGLQLGNCITAGEKALVTEGLTTVLLTEGGTLAASSEG